MAGRNGLKLVLPTARWGSGFPHWVEDRRLHDLEPQGPEISHLTMNYPHHGVTSSSERKTHALAPWELKPLSKSRKTLGSWS